MINQYLRLVPAMILCLLFSVALQASSHREAPLIADDPLADNTDVYAFRSPDDPNTVTIIANYIPMQLPHGGPNYYTFGENIHYEIHIDNDASVPGDEIIYRFTFDVVNEDPTTFFSIRLGQENNKATYTMERSMDGGLTFQTVLTDGTVPPYNIGPRSIESMVGLGTTYDQLWNSAIVESPDGERVFAGPVDDPFFVDLGGIFDLGNAPRQDGEPRDGLECFNVHSIAIQVPIAMLLKDGAASTPANILDGDYVIGVWASASRPSMRTLNTDGTVSTSGDFVQVSRLGMPLTNEAIIPIGEKDRWNQTSPYDANGESSFYQYFNNPELALYMDGGAFGDAVPAFSNNLTIQQNSLGAFDFTNGADGLFPLKGTAALDGTALAEAAFGGLLLPGPGQPRSVDLLPIFHTGVPNLPPYQLATGKMGNPLAVGKPFINNFLPNGGDMLRLNMATPITPRDDDNFSSLGLVQAAVLGLTTAPFNTNADLEFIPNMDGFPNGRRLEDDVTRIELQAVSGIVLAAVGLWYDDFDPNDPNASPVTPDLLSVLSYTTGVEEDDQGFTNDFPFLSQPRRGTGECSGTIADDGDGNEDPQVIGQFFVSTNTGGVVGVFDALDNGMADFTTFPANGTDSDGIVYDEDNDVLYQLDRTNNVVVAYNNVNTDLENGNVPTVSATSTSDFTNGREISLTGSKLIVAQDAADSNGNTNALFVYDVAAGAITLSASYTTDINLWGIHVQDETLYAIEDNSSNLAVYENFFANPNGAITADAIIPVAGIVRTHGITYDADTDLMVLTDVGSGAVADDGAIVIIDDYMQAAADGNISMSEQVRIAGSNTFLGNPVDVAVNVDNSQIYVAERANGGGRILGFSLPSNGGNIAPNYNQEFAGASAIYFVGTDQGDGGNGPQDNGTADLSLTVQTQGSTFSPFSNTVFVIQVTNAGPNSVEDVEVSLPIPSGFSFTAASTTNGVYNLQAERWTINSLAPGQTATFNYTLFALTNSSTTFYAEVDFSPADDPDSTPGNGNGMTPQEDDEGAKTLAAGNRPADGRNDVDNATLTAPTEYAMTVYPTTVKGGTATVIIDAPVAGTAQILLLDQVGRQVQNQEVELTLGRNRATINAADLAQGMYFVRLQAEGAAIPAQRLIKQ